MIRSPLVEALSDKLVERLGSEYQTISFRASGAGCINETYEAFGTGLESVFLKVGAYSALEMYHKEVKGLQLLAQCDAVRVPKVYFAEQLEGHAVLALEFIELSSVRDYEAAGFGEALAQLHGVTHHQFGLDHDNFIGRTHQLNYWQDNWWVFYCENRLLPQTRLAQAKGVRSAVTKKLFKLIEMLPDAMAHHIPAASLLHGDLWNGNIAVDMSGKATLYDPAVYYGDAETDLAMSKMFGALPQEFYNTYHNIMRLKDGHEQRQKLYDLYHWLNHFNLFGVTYLGQVEQTLDSIFIGLEQRH